MSKGQETWQPEVNLTELSPSVALALRGRESLSLSLSASSLPASSQRPGQVAEVDRAAQAGVCLQQGHDDRHGRLVVAGAAGTGLVHDVYAQVGVVAWKGGRVKQHLEKGKTPKQTQQFSTKSCLACVCV